VRPSTPGHAARATGRGTRDAGRITGSRSRSRSGTTSGTERPGLREGERAAGPERGDVPHPVGEDPSPARSRVAAYGPGRQYASRPARDVTRERPAAALASRDARHVRARAWRVRACGGPARFGARSTHGARSRFCGEHGRGVLPAGRGAGPRNAVGKRVRCAVLPRRRDQRRRGTPHSAPQDRNPAALLGGRSGPGERVLSFSTHEVAPLFGASRPSVRLPARNPP
jgi:hypothetical protein